MDGLRKWVRGLLEPPAASTPGSSQPLPGQKSEDPQQSLRQFYSESQPKWKWAFLWKCFRDLAGDCRFPKPTLREEPFERAVKKDGWPEDRSTPIARLVDSLRPYFAWPDRLAVVYSDRYRSAFIFAFLLAAFAVGMALLPVGFNLEPHSTYETLCIAIELGTILAILGLVHRGRSRHWHERWIDYRLAAELVRHLRLVAPLGGARPFPQAPAHWATYGQPGASWMAWYVRAVERVLGLPSVLVNREHLDACLLHLVDLISGQIEYHEKNARRCDRIEHQLHGTGIFLLALTLLACGVHLLPGLWPAVHTPSWLPPHLLTFFCGFFPALGAALAGINNQGEFRRITKRSEAMQEHLKPLLTEAEKLRAQINDGANPPSRQFSVSVGELSANTARLLVNEVLDWRVVFLDRPLIPPA